MKSLEVPPPAVWEYRKLAIWNPEEGSHQNLSTLPPWSRISSLQKYMQYISVAYVKKLEVRGLLSFATFTSKYIILEELILHSVPPFLTFKRKVLAFIKFWGFFTLYSFSLISWQAPITGVLKENWSRTWQVAEGIFKARRCINQRKKKETFFFYNSMLRKEENVMGGDSGWRLSDIHDTEQKCQS